MDLIDLTSRPLRSTLEAAEGELIFIPFVNHLMASLVRLAPTEIHADLGRVQGDVLEWSVKDLNTGEKSVLCSIPSRHFRSVLGAIGTQFLPDSLYGGCRSCRLQFEDRVVPAVLFLGNDRLRGLWFLGRSGRWSDWVTGQSGRKSSPSPMVHQPFFSLGEVFFFGHARLVQVMERFL